MYGNGAEIGMIAVITAKVRRKIRWGPVREATGFFAVAVGAPLTSSAVLLFAATAVRTAALMVAFGCAGRLLG